jgi:hypothetical protein
MDSQEFREEALPFVIYNTEKRCKCKSCFEGQKLITAVGFEVNEEA